MFRLITFTAVRQSKSSTKKFPIRFSTSTTTSNGSHKKNAIAAASTLQSQQQAQQQAHFASMSPSFNENMLHDNEHVNVNVNVHANTNTNTNTNTSNQFQHATTHTHFNTTTSTNNEQEQTQLNTNTNTNTNKFMLILGRPGGGKGTISNKILKDFPTFHHLSTGDLLRQHVREETEIGLQAKKHMDNGDLVPDDIMIQLVLHDATADTDEDGSKHLLLDGFPRTMEQAVALDKSLQVDLVVDLDVPVDTIVERISDRWIHPSSGRVYNYSYNPPKVSGKDDITNEDLIQRDDDKPETVRKRLVAYNNVTAPLKQYYADKGILKTFPGTKSDVIYVEVHKWLQEQMSDVTADGSDVTN